MEGQITESEEELLLLLDKNEDVEFLKKYILTIKNKSGVYLQSLHDGVVQILLRNPYPSLHLLLWNFELSQFQTSKAISAALTKYLEQRNNDLDSAFLSFLSNTSDTLLETSTVYNDLLNALVQRPFEELSVLMLYSRETNKLFVDLLNYWKWKSQNEYICKEFAAYQMLECNQHFLFKFVDCFNNVSSLLDPYLRNVVIILKLQNEFLNENRNIVNILDKFNIINDFRIDATPAALRLSHQRYYNQLQCVAVLLRFCKNQQNCDKIQIRDVVQANSILNMIAKSGINASYKDLHNILQSLYDLQKDIPNAKQNYEDNLELLIHYSALEITMDIITMDFSSEKNEKSLICGKIQSLIAIIRQIKKISQLTKVLEDVFKIMFLRRENLSAGRIDETKNKTKFTSRIIESSSSTGNIESDDINKRKLKTNVESVEDVKHGFICPETNLYFLLMKLKNYAMKKIHTQEYKLIDSSAKKYFQNILRNYCETFWKYEMLQKMNSKFTKDIDREYLLTEDEILPFIVVHEEVDCDQSSDDEVFHEDRCLKYSQKKSFKVSTASTYCGKLNILRRRKFTLNEKHQKLDQIIENEIPSKNSTHQHYNINQIDSKLLSKSCISKLFIPSENLASMALNMNKCSEVREIIKHYKLVNSEVDEQLNFYEVQSQVKQKLLSIYSNYQKLELCDDKPLATVDQIKSVAAKGFEVSKIISIVDNFARLNQIHQSSAIKELISKHVYNHYPFLKQYEEQNLNAILIADLMFDMPFNREITSHIIMIIKRQQKISSDIATISRKNKNDHIEHVSLPSEMGTMVFLENICECLRLMEQKEKNNDFPVTLCDILTNNLFSLRPNKLIFELQRKRAFEAIFFKKDSELGTLQDLKRNLNTLTMVPTALDSYNQFVYYLTNLKKLLKLRDANLELHTTELLKQDPFTIVGDLLFQNEMQPLELENSVSTLNLNLVHVIATNICPDIAERKVRNPPYRFSAKNEESIFNYVSKYSNLLLYLLKKIIDMEFNNEDTTISEQILLNYLETHEVGEVSKLYKSNQMIAGLKLDTICLNDVETLESKTEQLNILSEFNGSREFRLQRKEKIDQILLDLIKENSKNVILIRHMTDVVKKADIIKKLFVKLPSASLAEDLIQSTLTNNNALNLIPTDVFNDLEKFLSNIRVFDKVCKAMNLSSWTEAYDFGLKSPNQIFKYLLNEGMFKLCYEWSQAINLSKYFNSNKNSLLKTLLQVLLKLEDDESLLGFDNNLLNLLNSFPVNDLVNFLDENKDKFRSLALLEYSIQYIERNKTTSNNFKNYKVSLKMLKELKVEERQMVWSLMKNPLLVIEELIMNAKFEVLSRVLKPVQAFLKSDGSKDCIFCSDKRGNIYDIHSKSGKQRNTFQLGGNDKTNSAFILLNFNLYQQDHIITNECIDLLLRIYATKALDYNVSDRETSSDQNSQTSDMPSLDSLCDAFRMPKIVPAKEDWIRDEDASHCMSCRRTKFTMLMRRHHCRRCGRVVCFVCSMHRTKIPDFYADVDVRICNDCHNFLQGNKIQTNSENETGEGNEDISKSKISKQRSHAFKWELSGNITHDKLLREEFSYDHAPSVALCLSILEYHLGQEKCVDLLIYHCRKLEKLIVPNPEVDFELVAKMMNCLAVAAKVRGAPAEVETIREHAEIIIAIVQNGCENLIPFPFTKKNFRKMADSLVQAEHWKLALEVHLKWGFPTASVMIAHGLACLPAGAYETAREKFSHCMVKLTTEDFNLKIQKYIYSNSKIKCDNGDINLSNLHNVPVIKRPQRGPPILKEILSILSSLPIMKPQPETLHRASLLRSSNSSLVTLFSRRKEQYVTPPHEAGINILTRLANLKQISKGQYFETGTGNIFPGDSPETNAERMRQSGIYEESFHYVFTYGSHSDILTFFMNYNDLGPALRYCLYQNLEPDFFIQNIFLVMLGSGQVPGLISKMIEISDERLSIWQKSLLQTCRYLETKKLLNSLYQLQVLLKDMVRASMTCVKFYSSDCFTFKQLNDNAYLLQDAQIHLQSELEQSNWQFFSGSFDLSFGVRKKSICANQSRRSSTTTIDGSNFFMQLDARALNVHINTIVNQLDVTKFLAKCEEENSSVHGPITEEVLKQMRIDSDNQHLPTLFNGPQDKIKLCILILYCGKNIEEGFGLAFRIIQAYKLSEIKVFAATAKYLARNQRLMDVEKLLNCIVSNESISQRDLDEIASVAINSAVDTHEPNVKLALENLTKKIQDIELRISSHIFIGQLKSAYLLANKHGRIGDIKKIMRQAERTNQIHIKKLCEKKLNIDSSPKTVS